MQDILKHKTFLNGVFISKQNDMIYFFPSWPAYFFNDDVMNLKIVGISSVKSSGKEGGDLRVGYGEMESWFRIKNVP